MSQRRWLDNPWLGKELSGEELDWSEADVIARVRELADSCVANFVLNKRNADGRIYVGLGGLAYALWYVATRPKMVTHKQHLLAAAKKALEHQLDYLAKEHRQSKHDDCAFLLGNAGINATAFLLYSELGVAGTAATHLQRLSTAAATLAPLGARNEGADEMFVGRAGFLCALLNLSLKARVQPVPVAARLALVKATVASGRLGAAHFQPGHVHPPLVFAYHGHHYLGAAHGASAIFQMLLSFPKDLKAVDGKAEAEVKAAVDYFLDIQRPSGNFPSSMERIGDDARDEDDELWHWCHGAPGVVHLLARAYRHWGDDKYLQAALAAGEGIWSCGLLRKGPGICHGVAGNAYAFLLLHQLQPQRPSHLRRARAFAAFLERAEFRDGARTPDCPWSLHEGWAGTLCFLADLLEPAKAEFPLLPSQTYNYNAR